MHIKDFSSYFIDAFPGLNEYFINYFSFQNVKQYALITRAAISLMKISIRLKQQSLISHRSTLPNTCTNFQLVPSSTVTLLGTNAILRFTFDICERDDNRVIRTKAINISTSALALDTEWHLTRTYYLLFIFYDCSINVKSLRFD